MHSYVVVDAFTSEPLSGNPVAVFFDSDDLSPETMQRIAKEMNLSETTFLLRPEKGGDARVRIFTPVGELPFAGHPLLGTAIVLGARTEGDRLRLETAMGVIPFDLERDGDQAVAAWMRQPVPTWLPFGQEEQLLAALGTEKSTLPVEIYRNGPRHVFVGYESVEALSAARPDQRALAAFEDVAVNCFAQDLSGTSGDVRLDARAVVTVTQWRSRMFSPAYGVVEDAATGSAAGPLAIHLARHGVTRHGDRIQIMQGVEMGRPSRMYARAEGVEGNVLRVVVGGHGVITADGVLRV